MTRTISPVWHEALERMQKQHLISLPVTRSDGVLVGVFRRDDAEHALATMEER